MQPINILKLLCSFCLLSNSTHEMISETWQIVSEKREPGSCLLKAVQGSISISGVRNLTRFACVTGGFCVDSGENEERNPGCHCPERFNLFLPASLPAQLSQMYSPKVGRCQICTNSKAWRTHPFNSPRKLATVTVGIGDTDLLPRWRYLDWESNFLLGMRLCVWVIPS